MNDTYEGGKCYECKSDLTDETMPVIAIGGAKTANLHFYYCNNSACGRYKIYVRYS